MSKILSSIVLFTMVLLLTSSLNFAVKSQTPKWGGTLVWYLDGDPDRLNPALASSMGLGWVTSQLYNTLTKSRVDEATGNFYQVPELAETWEMSPDGLTYTFYLADNVTWHDGEPFTSADVEFTFEHVILPLHPAGQSVFGKVTDVECPDEYTVVFHLNQPHPDFMFFHCIPYAGIIAKHVFTHPDGTLFSGDEIMAEQGNPDYIIGTGPFTLGDWVHGSYLIANRNPNYFLWPLPYLDRIVYSIVPSAEVRTMQLLGGELDFVPFEVTSTDLQQLKDAEGIAVTEKGSEYAGSQYTIHLNLRHEILSNRDVREALSRAIDREMISELASGGVFAASTGAISRAWAQWDNPSALEPQYNETRSNELLDAAGYPRGTGGIRFSLRYFWDVADTVEGNKIAEILRDNFEAVGIELVLEPLDEDTLFDRMYYNWDFDLGMWSGFGTVSGWYQLYHSSNIKPGARLNCMGYNNSRIDYLLDQAFLTTDTEERRAYYWEYEEILANDLPCLSVIENPHYTAWNTEFIGFPVGVWGYRDPLDDIYWTKATQTEAPPKGGTTPEPFEGIPLEWVVGIVVVIIVIAAGALIYFRRKK